jgi:hypothetical protein
VDAFELSVECRRETVDRGCSLHMHMEGNSQESVPVQNPRASGVLGEVVPEKVGLRPQKPLSGQ